MKNFYFTILFIFIFGISQSQERPIRFQHITTEDGLVQGHILCMIQDKEGYIWIGTYYGLSRYDGYSFKLYSKRANDSTSIANNVVYSLFEDKEGYIWVGTVWGLDKFDKRTEIFEHIPVNAEMKALNNGFIHSIAQDKNGNIWVGTDLGGLNKVNYETKQVSYYQSGSGKLNQLQSNIINDLYIDNQDNIWAVTEGGGLSCMNIKTEQIKNYRHSDKIHNTIPSDKISCIFGAKNGKLWFGNSNGNLFTYNADNDNFYTYNFLPANLSSRKIKIIHIAEDSNGNILIATLGAGLVIFNPKTRASQICMHYIKDPETIISNEAYSLLIDRTGTVFVGTYGKGISTYSPARMKFPYHYVAENFDSEKAGDINSYTACVQDCFGRLIVGSYFGFFVYNKKTWEYKHYMPGKTYEDSKILSIAIAPDSSVWFGSNHSLHRYDKYMNKIKSYVFINDSSDHPIYAVKFDHLNNLWLGLFSTYGLVKVTESEWRNASKDNLKFKLYKFNSNDSFTIGGNQIWSINQDNKHNLWFATNNSVSKYNYNKDNFDNYHFTYIPKSIEFDRSNNLWVTTRGNGVYYYDVKSRKAKHYSTENGLCQNFVFGAIADKNGDIWFNTENGLSRFYPKTEKFRNYDVFDGLPSNRFDDRSEKLLPDGQIYMGTSKGFVVFNPNEIKDDTCKPNVVLTDFRISNISVTSLTEKVKGKLVYIPIGKATKLELTSNQRDFSLEFAALNFSAPNRIKYAYKLDGFDNDWINTDAKNRIARYTNLDGGKYTFLAKATNSDGVWNNTPLTIAIIVHPPFYKTLWFKIFIILSLLVLLFIFFKRRINEEIMQKQILASMVKERTAEITEKNEMLKIKAQDLLESNTLLEERQILVEEQKEELKVQRDELELINAQKDKLFSIIAHDLKNPFNIILGYADLLLKNNSKYTEEQRRKFLTYLKQSSQNAYFLLENLLQWSRSQNKASIFDPVVLNIGEIVEFNIKQMTNLFGQKEISIDFSKTDILVFADENMVNTILRNLLTNAIKFSHPKGNIFVSLTMVDDFFAKISIRDYGVGMKKETIDNLFQFDKNISQQGTAGEKGTGLGLMLCNDFIKANNGQLEVKSIHNEGTVISFTLPLAN